MEGTDTLLLSPEAAADPAETKQVIARTPHYQQAAALVDHLSDAGFPVERVQIVGRGLHSVEQITGRMTKSRAALAGAGAGAWFGLLLGLLFSLFVVGPAWFTMVLYSLLAGAIFGAVLGFVGHWATRGRRDFSSLHTLDADQYDVQVDPAYAADALRLAREQ